MSTRFGKISCLRYISEETFFKEKDMPKDKDALHDEYDFDDFDEFERAIEDFMKDPGQVTRDILAEGHPIYYREDDTPKECSIREYPNGRKELVRFVARGSDEIEVIKVLCDETA